MMLNILIIFIIAWLLSLISVITGYVLGKPWLDKRIAKAMQKEEKKP